jgi:hypothetical protein
MPFRPTTPGQPISRHGVGGPEGLFLATIDYQYFLLVIGPKRAKAISSIWIFILSTSPPMLPYKQAGRMNISRSLPDMTTMTTMMTMMTMMTTTTMTTMTTMTTTSCYHR